MKTYLLIQGMLALLLFINYTVVIIIEKEETFIKSIIRVLILPIIIGVTFGFYFTY